MTTLLRLLQAVDLTCFYPLADIETPRSDNFTREVVTTVLRSTVSVRPGDTYYAKIESLRAWSGNDNGDLSSFVSDTFVVVLIDPDQARNELNLMRYVQSEE